MFNFINTNKIWGHFSICPIGKYLQISAARERSDKLEILVEVQISTEAVVQYVTSSLKFYQPGKHIALFEINSLQ